MALLVASRPPVPPGQMTSTIYGHLRDGRCNEAVQILEYELQVVRLLVLSLITECGGCTLSTCHMLLQSFPTSRAALSLLAFALFQSEDFSAAAAL